MVVSLVPNFNRAMFEGLRGACRKRPYVTILTDFADYPPHFWMERQDQFLICGTPKAVEQARSLGYTDDRVFATSGMILRPRFYEPVNVDRGAEREASRAGSGAGLRDWYCSAARDRKSMLDIADAVPDTQLILICGKNESWRSSCARGNRRATHSSKASRRRSLTIMHLSDFFIGKPGPGSISEAVAMKLPVIVESNAWTLPQERYNAEWVAEQGAGVVLPNFRGIAGAVGNASVARSIPGRVCADPESGGV